MNGKLRVFRAVPQTLRDWSTWLNVALDDLFAEENTWAAAQTFQAPPVVPTYTVGTLPSASPDFQIIGVSDEAGGAVLAFSTGGAWRRVTDRAVVS